MGLSIWIIDDEWSNYNIEEKLLKEELKDCTIYYSKLNYANDLKKIGSKVDAVIVQISVNVSKEMIDKLTKCKIISVYGTGYNNVDVKYAAKKNIKIGYIPGYCAEDIADYVIGSIFYFNKNYGCFKKEICENQWGAQVISKPVRRVNTLKLFILGFGKIGQAVAGRAKALNIEVLAYSPHLTEENAKKLGVKKVDINEGLKEADFLSVHSVYTKETENLLSYEDFKFMKKTAYLINTSRGRVINQKDLIKAVKENIICGAMLDVLENEPPEVNDEVLHTEGIVITPHISYYSEEALNELQYRAAKNVVKVLKIQEGADLVQSRIN